MCERVEYWVLAAAWSCRHVIALLYNTPQLHEREMIMKLASALNMSKGDLEKELKDSIPGVMYVG